MEHSAELRFDVPTGMFLGVTRNPSSISIAQAARSSHDMFPTQAPPPPRNQIFAPYANQPMPYGPMGMMPMQYMPFPNQMMNKPPVCNIIQVSAF